MISGGSTPNPNNSNRVPRICITLRTNIILRSDRNYQSTISSTIYRTGISTMSVRGVCCRQRNPNAIFRSPLPNTICNFSNNHNPPFISTPNRIKQPARIKQKYRQNSLSSVLHSKGHRRIHNHHYSPISSNTKRTLYPSRPRQLHPSKPASNTSTHSTRMILPICIRNPTLNPKQIRRSNRTSYINRNPIRHTSI